MEGTPVMSRSSTREQCTSLAQAVFHPTHLRRTLTITLVVGSWLVFYNLGDVILNHGLTVRTVVKIALNYLTPFVVSNLGLLSRTH